MEIEIKKASDNSFYVPQPDKEVFVDDLVKEKEDNLVRIQDVKYYIVRISKEQQVEIDEKEARNLEIEEILKACAEKAITPSVEEVKEVILEEAL